MKPTKRASRPIMSEKKYTYVIKIKYKIPNHFPSRSHNRSPRLLRCHRNPKKFPYVAKQQGKKSPAHLPRQPGEKFLKNGKKSYPHRASQPSMQSLKNLNSLRRCKNAMKQKMSRLLRFHRNQQSCRGWTRTTVLVLLASAPPGPRSAN